MLDLLHRHASEETYRLHAACVMPNHLHVVLTTSLVRSRPFLRVWQGVKGQIAREANRLLGRTRPFWQPETYDHVVRDGQELTRIIQYTNHNPVAANLCSVWEDWPLTYLQPDRQPTSK